MIIFLAVSIVICAIMIVVSIGEYNGDKEFGKDKNDFETKVEIQNDLIRIVGFVGFECLFIFLLLRELFF